MRPFFDLRSRAAVVGRRPPAPLPEGGTNVDWLHLTVSGPLPLGLSWASVHRRAVCGVHKGKSRKDGPRDPSEVVLLTPLCPQGPRIPAD